MSEKIGRDVSFDFERVDEENVGEESNDIAGTRYFLELKENIGRFSV